MKTYGSKIYLTCALLVMSVSACNSDSWFGGDEGDKPLEGKRISALEHRVGLKQDASLANVAVILPNGVRNKTWGMQHVSPVENLIWDNTGNDDTVSIVAGGDENLRLTSTPIIAEGFVVALGADGEIVAASQDNPDNVVWKHQIATENAPDDMFGLGVIVSQSSKEFIGGNIAYHAGLIFATTRRGDVLALDVGTGEKRWQRSVKLPVKSSPVVHNGKLYLITSDNRLYALDAMTGETQWMHAGITETTSMYGAPSPAATEGWVVAPYSSGEVHALEAEKGRIAWSDVLSSTIRHRPSSIVLSSNATPVIRDGVVYVTSYDGVLAAADLTSGARLWTQDVGGLDSPWVAGDYLFLLTSDQQLVCVHRETGKIKWVSNLPHYATTSSMSLSDKGERIHWSAPVVINGEIVVAGSQGVMYHLDAKDGRVVHETSIPHHVLLAPVVVDGKLYVLSNDGVLGIKE